METDLVLSAFKITGVSGFVGFRILATALERGHRVRAVIRREDQEQVIRAAPSIQPHQDKLEFAIVRDMVDDGSYDEAIKGVTHAVHAAFPATQRTEDYRSSVIDPVVRSVANLLQATRRSASVRRVVVTSSICAVVPWTDFAVQETSNIWRDTDINSVSLEPQENPFKRYCTLKTLCLHTTNDFMKSLETPSFDVINIMPSFIIGKNELAQTTKSLLDGSNGLALGPILGDAQGSPTPSLSVLLDDVARIHIAALNPSIQGNQNFIASSGGLAGTNWEDGLEIAQQAFPQEVRSGILPLGGKLPQHKVCVDASRTETVFGMQFAGFEEQIVSVTKQYIELYDKEST